MLVWIVWMNVIDQRKFQIILDIFECGWRFFVVVINNIFQSINSRLICKSKTFSKEITKRKSSQFVKIPFPIHCSLIKIGTRWMQFTIIRLFSILHACWLFFFFFHYRNIYLTPDFCYTIGQEMDISEQTKFELPAWALTTFCYCSPFNFRHEDKRIRRLVTSPWWSL